MTALRIRTAVVALATLLSCASTPERDTSDALVLVGIIPTELAVNQLVYENLETGREASFLFTKRALKLESVPPGDYRLVRVESLYDNVVGGALAPEDHPVLRVKPGFINYIGAVRVDRKSSTHSHVMLDVHTFYPPEAIEAARGIWPDAFASHEVHTAMGTE